ncbi:hypothetical protein NLJ89_g5937 [Agrocybe chaxingu]|uniref:Uncharacterized protein n=1 Tax=Agrocybe chaxingu TaxID=84603 RepID=A0A9W8K6J4_9AGAR|nr:hypothetical protein NLJ89_g5937 [Agrocybe chaxingu]
MMILMPASLGDIVALAQIITLIANALKEGSGASEEYQDLIDDLFAFCRTLDNVKDFLEQLEATPINEKVRHGIYEEILRCRALVNSFLAAIAPYYRALRGQVRTSRRRFSMRVVFRKVWWALFRREDVARVQKRIMAHQMNLVIFITTTSVEKRAIASDMPKRMQLSEANAIEVVDFCGESILLPEAACFPMKVRNVRS